MNHPTRHTPLRVAWIVLAIFVAVTVAFGNSRADNSADPRPVNALPAAPAVDSNGWTRVFTAPEVAPGLPFHFYGMTFVDQQIGYAYGGVDWDAGVYETPGRIYKTTDAGQTWTLVHESPGWKIAMACWDAMHCWAGGRWGRIVYTLDGGQNWYLAASYTWADPPGPTPTPVPFTAWIRSGAAYPGAGNPIIFGSTDNVILRSTDGQRFDNYWPPLLHGVATWGMDCPTPSMCYGGQIKQWIVKTTDGGKTWNYTATTSAPSSCHNELRPEPIQQRYYGLDFVNQYWGWAVGSCGAIFNTNNGGLGWDAQNANISVDVQFRAVRMFDLTHGIAVGGKNPDFVIDPSNTLNAVVYATTDGKNWIPVAAPDTSELHGMGAFGMSGVVVADWDGNIWRRNGSVLDEPPTLTPTATSTPTASATPTATATSTSSPTPTATATPAIGILRPRAFADANGDGLYAPGDLLLAGAQLELRAEGQVIGNCATDTDGACQFADLAPGLYTLISKSPPPGYTSMISALAVVVQGGATVGIDLPYEASTPTPTATATPTETPTATPTATPTRYRVWLPLVVRE